MITGKRDAMGVSRGEDPPQLQYGGVGHAKMIRAGAGVAEKLVEADCNGQLDSQTGFEAVSEASGFYYTNDA